MQPTPTQATQPTQPTETKKKIIIIGSGTSGLSSLLNLLRGSETFELLLYTKQSKSQFLESMRFNERTILLWRAGLAAALDMGLGARLGRLGQAVNNVKSLDVYPSTTWTSTASTASTTATTNALLVDWASNSNLPPIVALRKVDLIRTLMTAIAGRSDLVHGADFVPGPANNASDKLDPVRGIEADLARGNWFEDEGFSDLLLPFIKFECELESFVISAENGTVYVKFTNGTRDQAFLLLGCDGPDSTVRSLLFNDRFQLEQTRQLVIHGLTPIPAASQSTTQLTRAQMLDFARPGSLCSWMGRDVSVSVVNVGMEGVAWTLVVPQSERGQVAAAFTLPKRRRDLALGIGGADAAARFKDHDIAYTKDDISYTKDDSAGKKDSTGTKADVFAGSCESEDLSGEECRELAIHLLTPHLGVLPPQISSIVSQTQESMTSAHDNIDLHGENVVVSLTSPNFHPGRVMLVGSAAHPLASTVHGNHSASLSLCDALCLSNLILHYFTPSGYASVLQTPPPESASAPVTPDMLVLGQISREYTALRAGVGASAVTDTYKQATWVKAPEGIWKSISVMAGMTRETWATHSFEEEMERGAN